MSAGDADYLRSNVAITYPRALRVRADEKSDNFPQKDGQFTDALAFVVFAVSLLSVSRSETLSVSERRPPGRRAVERTECKKLFT